MKGKSVWMILLAAMLLVACGPFELQTPATDLADSATVEPEPESATTILRFAVSMMDQKLDLSSANASSANLFVSNVTRT